MATCKECAKEYTRRRFDQIFCSTECRKAEANREMVRAKIIYRAVYHWANDRKRGNLLSVIAQEARAWKQEDEALGLPPPPLPEEGGYKARDRLTERLDRAEKRRKAAKLMTEARG